MKATFPNGPFSPFSIWFSRILLVDELRTHEFKFIDEGVRYPHDMEVGRNLKNYRKVRIVHVRMMTEHGKTFFSSLMDNNYIKPHKDVNFVDKNNG